MKYEYLATATAYADAKGLPYETKTKQQITALGGVASELIAPDTFSTDFPDFRDKPIGTWSDDTQHTLAMMESLVEGQRFDLRNLALRLKAEMETSEAGWGGATKRSIQQVDEHKSEKELRNLGATDSNGCGPLMRLAPLAIYQVSKGENRFINLDVMDTTTLTHNSAQSCIASLVHASVLCEIITTEGQDRTTQDAWNAAKQYEAYFDGQPMLSDKITKTYGSKNIAEDVYDSEEEAFSVWSVLAVSCAVYDRMKDAPFEELIDAVILEGGDTDSTAAIVAGMWVCAHPDKNPGVKATTLQHQQRLIATGKVFATLIASQSS